MPGDPFTSRKVVGSTGAAPVVNIFGEDIRVEADIYTLGGLSAHGDQRALLDWLGHFSPAPKQNRARTG